MCVGSSILQAVITSCSQICTAINSSEPLNAPPAVGQHVHSQQGHYQICQPYVLPIRIICKFYGFMGTAQISYGTPALMITIWATDYNLEETKLIKTIDNWVITNKTISSTVSCTILPPRCFICFRNTTWWCQGAGVLVVKLDFRAGHQGTYHFKPLVQMRRKVAHR